MLIPLAYSTSLKGNKTKHIINTKGAGLYWAPFVFLRYANYFLLPVA
jgi:hypothetical protein